MCYLKEKKKLFDFFFFLLFLIIIGNRWFALSSVNQTKEQTLHKISVDSAFYLTEMGCMNLLNNE